MIRRRRDWSSRLVAWADGVVGQPFVWGSTDCGSLARAALEAMYGQDVLHFLPRWNTSMAAGRVLVEHGTFSQILERAGAVRGGGLAFRRSGDLLVCEEPEEVVGGESVMVCTSGLQCVTTNLLDGVALAQVPNTMPCAVFSIWEVPAHGSANP